MEIFMDTHPSRERVKNSVCGFEIPSVRKNYLPDLPNSLAASLPLRCRATQGIFFKPLLQLHKTGCESHDRGAILK
jgi:hypothetical protein